METLVSGGDAADPTNFAKNTLEIAVPPDNPAKIATLADLAKRGVKVALCQAQVPCGAVAAKVFTNAKLTVKPVTEEADVKSVLTKVTLGEVDAGVVYMTDVQAAGDKVNGIDIPADVNASTTYPIATLKAHQAPAGGRRLRRLRALRRRRRCSSRPASRAPDGESAATGSAPRGRWVLPPWSALLFLSLPLVGLLVRAPWRGLARICATSEVLDALRLSL